MSEYRRIYQPGGNYFFTLVTFERRTIFTDPEKVGQLKAAIEKVKLRYPFSLDAIVVLPDHLHCLWRLPENDQDFSTRWRLIKRYFSMEMNTSLNQRNEKKVWQRRFWEHLINDEADWEEHMDYIHYNPVKHGLSQSPKEWPYTSFNYWVEQGRYENDWGNTRPITFRKKFEIE